MDALQHPCRQQGRVVVRNPLICCQSHVMSCPKDFNVAQKLCTLQTVCSEEGAPVDSGVVSHGAWR